MLPRILLSLAALVLGCVTFLSRPLAAAEKPSKPNVLFILADDLGYSDLGCYGSEIETPNLDALAKDGLRFTQAYNTARCWPSRAALLTGFYPQATRRDQVEGVQSGGKGMRPAWAKLLPDMLRPAGYRSYHSGKWHIDGVPMHNGFDHSFEIGAGQNNHFSDKGNSEDGKPVPHSDSYYSSTGTADHAIKCLQEHAEKYSGQPFFQYLAFIAPHFPLHAPAEDVAKYRDRYKAGWNVVQAERYRRQRESGIITTELPPMEREVGPPYTFPDAYVKLGLGEEPHPLPWNELTAVQKEFQAAKMAVHAAMVDRMDKEIGRVIAQLKAMGALENTMIIFASDNGASAEIMVRGNGHDPQAAPGSAETFLCLGTGWSSCSNTPFRRHKTWVHEGGISTPFIVHWPMGIAAKGELRHAPIHLIDFVPTVLELAGVAPTIPDAPPLQGKSFAAALAKDTDIPRDFIWWQHEGNRAIRAGNMKLVAAGEKAAWQLYDVSKDRGELHDLAATQPDKVKELSTMWQKQLDILREIALRDNPPAATAPQKKGKKKQVD